MKPGKINVSDTIKAADLTATVKVTGVKRLRLRLWLALKIVRFGLWLAHTKLEVQIPTLPEIGDPYPGANDAQAHRPTG